MKWEESFNRNSLVKFDVDFRQEPNNHISYEEKRVSTKKYNAELEKRDGWVVKKTTKTQVVLRRYVPDPLAYEYRIWQLFFKMGFPFLNKYNKNNFYYGHNQEKTVNFSIFGRDKDKYTFVFVDCFTKDNKEDLNDKLDNMQHEFNIVANYVRGLLEDDDILVKYIIAIKGFELSEDQEKIIKECNFTLLSEIDIDYFEELYSNLQDAAYFQFCGKLFEGMTIPKLNTKIPAIRGRMGGHTYYSFSIDPQILLRLSFVLHKTKAHEEAMPTYQRLVKKSRLKSITDFLNNHGFFPNSIVINLDEECEFERAEPNILSDTAIGHLIIPQKYRVAYIIDGQHRLMGYAGCRFGNQQIPVVAFENLNKVTQVKLFMEMNENQKAVPKELRLTLYKDLLPSDPRLSQRMYGLRLQIAFSFADHKDSPLKGYVGDGVDRREYTLEYFQQALKASPIYFGEVRNERLISEGIFFRGDTEDTNSFDNAREAIRDFLFMCVRAFIDGSGESLEDTNNSNVFIRNIGMNGYLRFVADLVNYKKDEIEGILSDDAKPANPEAVYEIIMPYLTIAFKYARECEQEEGSRLKSWTGGKAPVQYQRSFQRELHNVYEDFNPSGLEDWIANTSSEVVEEALGLISQLKTLIYTEFTNRFGDKIGVDDWVADSLPDEIDSACYERRREFYSHITTEQKEEKSLWDFVEEKDYFKIACHSTNDPLIKDHFTYPGMKKSSKREKRYEWMKDILKIEKECIETHICESDSIEELRKLYDHFTNNGLIQEEEQE